MWLADLPGGHRARPLSKELESEQLDLLAMLAGQSSVSRPNGSRLSCGAHSTAAARVMELVQKVVAHKCNSSLLVRRRQLQALVRRRRERAVEGCAEG